MGIKSSGILSGGILSWIPLLYSACVCIERPRIIEGPKDVTVQSASDVLFRCYYYYYYYYYYHYYYYYYYYLLKV